MIIAKIRTGKAVLFFTMDVHRMRLQACIVKKGRDVLKVRNALVKSAFPRRSAPCVAFFALLRMRDALRQFSVFFNISHQKAARLHTDICNAPTGVPISPYPDLLPDVFCLMARIFRLMLVLLYI